MLYSSIANSELNLPILTDLVAWWDASDSSTITHSSGSVSQITDKSGNGHTLTQGTSTAQPKINTATLNGLPVLDFDGGDSLVCGNNSIGRHITGVTAYIVMKFDSGSTQVPFSVARNDTSARRLELNQYLGLLWWVHRPLDGGSEYFNTSDTLVSTSTYFIYSVKADYGASTGPTKQFWGQRQERNGTTTNTTTSNTHSVQVKLGDAVWTSFPLDGKIAEVLVYNANHSDSDLFEIVNYLRKKWGLFPSADGQITWDDPVVIPNGDLSALDTQSNQTLEYGWVFATTPATVGGITFTLASLDDETGEGSGVGLFTHSNSGFQNLLDGYEFALNPVTLTLTGLTVGNYYEVQLFSIDIRTSSNLDKRRCYFYDTSGNTSKTFLSGASVSVKGRFRAAATTQVVKHYALGAEAGGAGPAGFINAAILRRFN